MRLTALLALVPVVACATLTRWRELEGAGIEGAGIEDDGRGVDVSILCDPEQFPQVMDNDPKRAGLEPALGVLIDGLPVEKLNGEITPRSAGLHTPEGGIEYLPLDYVPVAEHQRS
jgi:hypothetical protein